MTRFFIGACIPARCLFVALTLHLSTARADEPSSGDELFRAGRFAEAEEAYQAAFQKDKSNPGLSLRLGEIALLSNRLDEAEAHLTEARRLAPAEKKAASLLAETFVRRDDLARAAELLTAAGRQAYADKLASFKGAAPYEIEGAADTARIKFVQADPLPLLTAVVAGPGGVSQEANLILDTGGGELILDPEFADKLGCPRFGMETGQSFGGDRSAPVEQSRVESIQLGELRIKNVPVVLLGTRSFSAAASGKRVDGVLGTVLLYHFVSTIDYPRGELVLRRQSSNAAPPPIEPGEKVMSFWLAGDHLILAWARLGTGEPFLALVDTGLAGGGFACPQSTIEAAKIDLSHAPVFQGTGGGGPVDVRPFVIDELSLGEMKRTRINAFAGAFPESLERRYDFRIGGLVSHAFLRPFAVTFDFQRMQIRLRPQP